MVFNVSFFHQQLRRELSGKHRGASPLWVLFQPLLLLAVYSFVFTQIFQARVPAGLGTGFVAYLAVGYWPWSAFSESVLRNLGVIAEHGGLIRKVAMRRELLVLARVCSIFLLHLAGFLAVLLVLAVAGYAIHWQWLPVALLLIALLSLLALGIGLCVSAINVIVPALQQMVQPLMLLLFFSTPILWAPSMLPAAYRPLVAMNPLAWWVGSLRDLLLAGELPGVRGLAIFIGIVLVILAIGHFLFRRLAPHFEDYL